jgi:DivIVA domain-containing protein
VPDHSPPFPGQAGAALARWVESKQFSTTRLRPGYDEAEVDAFLDRVRDTLAGAAHPPLAPAEVRNAQFTLTRAEPSYARDEVDSFLDAVRGTLLGSRIPPLRAGDIDAAGFGPASCDPAIAAVRSTPTWRTWPSGWQSSAGRTVADRSGYCRG